MLTVMAFVLGACSCYKVVECLHLSSHVFHLGIDYADCLFMNGLGSGLNGDIALTDSLPVVLHPGLQGIPRGQDFADEQCFFLRPEVHTGIIVFICTTKRRSRRRDILSYGTDTRLPS